MQKKRFFYLSLWVVFLFVLSGCQDEKMNDWLFDITDDQDAYIIKDYLGEEKNLVLPETHQGKPVIGLSDDFRFPNEVKEIILSKNLETFYKDRNLNLRLDALTIPEDAHLKHWM